MAKYVLAIFFVLITSCAYASGCFDDRSSRQRVAPLTSGPLAPSFYYCRPEISKWVDLFVVSPNGHWTAFLSDRTVNISSLDGKETITYSTGLSSPDGIYREGFSLLKWANDSQSVWTSEREVAKPSGFALSGLKPLRILLTGNVEKLPPLNHPAGSLDKLLWIDGNGLAFAVFGTYSSYSPPRPADPNAAYAIVDAARGRVLDSFPILNVVHDVIQDKPFPNSPRIKNAAMTVLADGRVRLLLSFLQFNEWVLWTQNEKPRLLRHPYMDLPNIQQILSPDGGKVLVFQNIHTNGAIIEETRFGGRGYVPGKPVNGLLASLYDLDSGKELWKISARVTSDPSGDPPAPVISKDGRFALIRFPADTEGAYIALVSMLDGKILQRLLIPNGNDSSSFSMGFSDQGVWTRTYNLTTLYGW